ncbi:MAG: ATP-binding protein [Betaproteobacteria bacterium]|nr:ATP-binding protein [Betaproteobacteria bacterium]
MFPARLTETARLRAFVDVACDSWGITRAVSYKLHLIVEELFTNTVKHGHRGDCDAPVWVGVSCDESALHLTFADQAPAFNPLAHAASISAEQGAVEHKVGGLGVLLVSELACKAEYTYVYGRNRVRLSVRR